MSDKIVGPSLYLPGKVLQTPRGAMCDHHPTVPAQVRLVGEVTPEGAELHDLCMPCARLINAHLLQQYENVCDLCGFIRPALTQVRDPNEGLNGRIYEACRKCISELADVALVNDPSPLDDDEDDEDRDVDPPENFTDFAPLR